MPIKDLPRQRKLLSSTESLSPAQRLVSECRACHLIDENGDRVRHQVFTPFGAIHDEVGANFRTFYAGHRRDEGSGMFYMQARWYDPGAGRFLSIDPMIRAIGVPQSANPYSYSENNPVNGVDPTGTETVPVMASPGSDIQVGTIEINNFQGGEIVADMGGGGGGAGAASAGSFSGGGASFSGGVGFSGLGSVAAGPGYITSAGNTSQPSNSSGSNYPGGQAQGDGGEPYQVADVRIKGSAQVKGADVIDVSKKVADKIAEKSGSPKARRVAEKIDAIDRARNPTVIKTDKIDAQITVTGDLDPIDPPKSRLAVEVKIKF